MGIEYAVLRLGQSNAEPIGDLPSYLALVPSMDVSLLTPDPTLSATYGYAVDSIRYLTFYKDAALPVVPPDPAPPAPFDTAPYNTFDYYCKFLEWCALNGGSNPHPANFDYPNHFATPAASYGALMESSLDLGRRMVGWLKQRVNIIPLSVSGSWLQLTEEPLALTAYGWFDNRIHTNWNPGDTNGLCARLLKVLRGAKMAAEFEGNTLRIILVTMKQGENDSQNEEASAQWPVNAPAFVDFVRKAIYDLGLTDGAAAQIPFVWAQIPVYPWGTPNPYTPSLAGDVAANVTLINGTLQKMQRDDHYFATYATDDVEHKTGDPLHYSHVGHMTLAERDFAALLAIRDRATASFPDVGNVTLAQLREQVLRITERNTSEHGQDSDVVNEAINDAYLDLIQAVGDTTWWLRMMLPFTLISSPTTPVELPRVVTRLLEIRSTYSPLLTFDYTMIGHSDRGRVQIATLDYVNASVVLHHQYEPARLVADGERVLLPSGYIEAVKIGAARRIAESTSNIPMKLSLSAQEQRLIAQVCMHAQKVDRQRRQRMTGGSRRMRFYSQGSDPWSNHPWQ